MTKDVLRDLEREGKQNKSKRSSSCSKCAFQFWLFCVDFSDSNFFYSDYIYQDTLITAGILLRARTQE